ncbi:ImmA/IrrE family metallo-endopeptidase [Paenibacillus sp. FSL K6-2524]|uniref:ImmA/IrrE family metallo-endopeptidase n=1 Tax=Paenibacillus sp. FSL K6-2524 TaxID=2954516 RepID=UPI0030FD144E
MEKKLAQRLNRKHETNDPFELIKLMDITILLEDLGFNTWGYYTNVCRIPCIHINKLIAHYQQRYAAAHELGHHLLHKGISTPFLRANTLQSVDKIEYQANQFAVELLIPDKLLLEGATIYEAAAICGVPEEVALLKRPPKKGLWTDECSFINI